MESGALGEKQSISLATFSRAFSWNHQTRLETASCQKCSALTIRIFLSMLLHSILSVSLTAVESYLAQGKDGELGVTGEGTLLDNAQGTFTVSVWML